MDYQYISDDEYGVIDDFKETYVEPTEELLEAIKALNVAMDDDYCEEQNREQTVIRDDNSYDNLNNRGFMNLVTSNNFAVSKGNKNNEKRQGIAVE